MVVGGDSEQLRSSVVQEAPVNPDVFHDRPQIPGTVADRVSDRAEVPPDSNLEYARATATETANMFLLRTSPVTPAEFKVMGGVLDLGIKTGAWTPENFQQIKECLEARAGHQQNSVAAKGLLDMASQMDRYIPKSASA
jgi:hypothetical protein